MFERKDAAKEAKKRAVLSLVQSRYKGANRSPRIFHDVKNSRNHAIGHDMQTIYGAPALRASVAKTEFASTRRTCPTSRRDCSSCRKYHATLGPRTESEVADPAASWRNNLVVPQPHHHQTESDVRAINPPRIVSSFCNFFVKSQEKVF